MTNCPNCAAPITGPVCEYCGTVFNKPSVGTVVYTTDNIPYLTLYTPNEARELMGLPRIKDLEAERYAMEARLLEAKMKTMAASDHMKRLYGEAIAAMRGYAE